MESSDRERHQNYFQAEIDCAALYRALARIEAGTELVTVYTRMAETEERHAEIWRTRLREAGVTAVATQPAWRTRAMRAVVRVGHQPARDARHPRPFGGRRDRFRRRSRAPRQSEGTIARRAGNSRGLVSLMTVYPDQNVNHDQSIRRIRLHALKSKKGRGSSGTFGGASGYVADRTTWATRCFGERQRRWRATQRAHSRELRSRRHARWRRGHDSAVPCHPSARGSGRILSAHARAP
jgi:hypothetical protein